MNFISRLAVERLPAKYRRSAGSLRTHLIFWNIVAVSSMLVLLGVVCRFVTLQVIMGSVNDEMARAIRMYKRPPRFGPGMNGEHGHQPGGPQDASGALPQGPPPGAGPHNLANHRMPGPPDADNPYHPHFFTSSGASAMRDDKRAVWDEPALKRALVGETIYSNVTIDDEPLRILSAPAYTPDASLGAVQYAYPLKEVYRAVSGINLSLLLLAPLGLAGAGWVGTALTNRVLRRVHTMTQAAGRIGAADFSRRLPVSGDDEFSSLAETFNGLLGGLDLAYQQQQELMKLQQRFTADASHELKTPLTIIKGRAGLSLERSTLDDKTRRAFEEIETAANTMDHLVQDLLLLARSDEGQLGRQQTELLVSDVLQSARRHAGCAADGRVRINLETEELVFTGNEAELVRVFRNLIDNALSYSAEEMPVEVAARREGNHIVITITDHGDGIAPEHLPHLGERFYRVDASRTRPTGGTGLGLSICGSIVSAHGGSLAFESQLGVGTTVTVELPSVSR